MKSSVLRTLMPCMAIAPGPPARSAGTGPAAAGLDFQRAPFSVLSEPPPDATALVRLAESL